MCLSDELLDQLERRWRDQGAIVARLLRPGLTDEEMDAVTAPLGIHLPREARRWWGWHDGARPPAPGARPAELGPSRWFMPLADAVANCESLREVDRPLWGRQLGPGLTEASLPIDGCQMPALLDCSVGFDDPIPPVRAWVFDNPDAATRGGEIARWLAFMGSSERPRLRRADR